MCERGVEGCVLRGVLIGCVERVCVGRLSERGVERVSVGRLSKRGVERVSVGRLRGCVIG